VCRWSSFTDGTGGGKEVEEEPYHTTSKKLGTLGLIQYSLPIINLSLGNQVQYEYSIVICSVIFVGSDNLSMIRSALFTPG
jgi:hypothetical protein